MKKVVLILVLLVSFYFLSCDNSFNPYAPFTEEYALNGIIRGDTSFQVVTLSHIYQPGNSDPLTYKTDPSVIGARVELTYDNKIYVLRDSSISRTDTSHYDTPFEFYYTNNIRPDINKTISIRAVLPNGKVLSAGTKTPNTSFDFSGSNNYFPPSEGSISSVVWANIGDYLYAPDLNIIYQVVGDSGLYKITLPMLLKGGGTSEYIQPSKAHYVSFDTSTVRKTLDKLANKYGDRSKLKIINITLNLLVFDEYLSAYYSSLQLGLDGVTVTIDSPDFSNVNGGYGIFGCYEKTTQIIYFSSSYIHNLGFQY